MPFFDPIRIGASGAVADFTVDRSLRFNDGDSPNLARTPSGDGDKKKWTWSSWIKISANGTLQTLFSVRSGNRQSTIFLKANGQLQYFSEDSGGTTQANLKTDALLRDPSAWYHVVVHLDAANTTGKIYLNGVEQSLEVSTAVVNTDHNFNTTLEHLIGNEPSQSNYFDGYMAEINFIDGQALTPSSFGETNSTTGQWVPINTSGLTFGTNGFRLQFADNSNTTATTLGKDTSGNGHNFTPNNFAVSDSITDTPSKNFCTLNPLNATNDVDLREGNLEFFQSSNDESATATFGITSGKWYWEVYKNSSENPELGIDTLVRVLSSKSDDVSNTKVTFRTNGGDQQNGAGSAISLTGSSSGQTGAGVIAIAVDFDNKKIWYSDLSGNFFNSGNPATGSNAALDFSSVAVANGCVPYVFIGTGGNNSCNVNFGQDGTFAGHTTAGGYADGNGHGNFKYSVPSGYLALCSANLPDPTILLPNNHFDTLLYTGNNGTQNITGLNFDPDWVWGKNRQDAGYHHDLYDSVRGDNLRIFSSQNSAEATGYLQFGVTGGFTLTAGGGININAKNHVAWCWSAGGSTVTNNDGATASQVRANTSAGFSIVTYTGTGDTSETYGHGLGVKPDCIIVKCRNTAGQDWAVYHKDLNGGSSPAERVLKLNSTAAEADLGDVWFDTEPTSSVFTVGDEFMVNGSSSLNYVAYCFSEVAGYSKFGSYTGNNNDNGTFVFLGFRPAFLIIRVVNTVGDWVIMDNTRSTTNPNRKLLYANTSSAEGDGIDDRSPDFLVDFLSNGFKCRATNNDLNKSEEYIYLSFAESPFKNARAR